MKHTVLMLVMLCLSATLFADKNESAKDLAQLVRLLPDGVTRSSVKEMFGEAAVITINNNASEETWQYANDVNLLVRWDTKKGQLRYLSFSSHMPSAKNWSNEYLSGFQLASTTMQQVMHVLGSPTDLLFTSIDYRLKYIYADSIVELQFKKGVLSNIHVSLNDKRKVDNINTEMH